MTSQPNLTEIASVLAAFAVGLSTLFTFIVRLMIKAALADFLVKLNGTYVRSTICKLYHEENERRLLNVEAKLERSESA